jgi:hypothetical protein
MPGELRVHLDGDTPGLETYLVSTDAGRRTPAGAVFTWKLHSGANRLSVVPRNIAGREGIESWIEVNYEP